MSTFSNRVFGCAIIKAINSNYNADFTHQPRMLPDGVAYATDKAFKYLIKFYLIQNSKDNNIFYFKRSDKAMNPLDLAATYLEVFKKEVKDDGKQVILKNLLSCLDVRMFGATFAPKGAGIDKKNISIHGPVQICHGMNRFPESIIFSEQIMSPFANQKDKKKDDSTENDEEVSKASMTTLGSQSKLREGHYVHHFSINPKNLTTHINQAGDGAPTLTEDDIKKLKEAMRRGATNYDSAAKAGTENEFLLWVQLKQDSNIVLPNFTPLVEIPKEKTADGKVKINLTKIKTLLNREGIKGNIEKVEYYFNPDTTSVEGTDEGWWEKHETL